MAATDIMEYVPAFSLWDAFLDHEDELEEVMVCVAENTETGYKIFMTEDEGRAKLLVYKGDKDQAEAVGICDGYTEARMLLNNFVKTYLTPVEEVQSGQKSGKEPDKSEDLYSEYSKISERQLEMKLAFRNFMRHVMGDKNSMCPDAVDDIYTEQDVMCMIDDVLYAIASYGISIYYPVDADGEIIDYPYDELALHDRMLAEEDADAV